MNNLKLLERLLSMLLIVVVVAGCRSAPATSSTVSATATATTDTSAALSAQTSTAALSVETATAPVAATTPAETAAAPATETALAETVTETLVAFEEFEIDVGGYKLFMECSGEGSPVVILDAGAGDDHLAWFSVQSEIARFTRVCSYDRAGTGRSGFSPIPRTSQDMIRDLHTLLSKANISGPYVLAGHSLGGSNVLLYADQYSEEVVGIILVDSTHPDQWSRMLAVLPPETPGESRRLSELRDFFSRANNPNGPLPEGLDWEASAAQLRAAGPVDDIPMIVLTAGVPALSDDPGLPPDVRTKLAQVWLELQQDLVGLSTNSTQIIVENSGHRIHLDQPQAVVDAIRTVLEAARNGTPVNAAQ